MVVSRDVVQLLGRVVACASLSVGLAACGGSAASDVVSVAPADVPVDTGATATATSSDVPPEGSEAASSSATSPSSSARDAVMLADYDATVYTELGEPLKLSFIADGRPLLINFWATWCPYCIEEMPDLQEIYGEYRDRVSFAFVDVVNNGDADIPADLAWLEEQGLELPVYFDTDHESASVFGVWSLPTTVLVDGHGEVLAASPGRIDPDLLRGALATVV